MKRRRPTSSSNTTAPSTIERLLAGPTAIRDAPTAEQVRQAFRLKVDRKQRASDGTVSIGAVRFEVPSCYRHLSKLTVRYARWDLSSADLWDDSLGVVLATIYPVDREANASGFRRPLGPVQSTPMPPKPSGMAPLLRHYVEQHRQTGLPPAYLPKDDLDDTE
jgi:putative transposase